MWWWAMTGWSWSHERCLGGPDRFAGGVLDPGAERARIASFELRQGYAMGLIWAGIFIGVVLLFSIVGPRG